MKKYKVLCVNTGAINRWFIIVDAISAEDAVSQVKNKYYGVYPQLAMEA